MTYQEYFAVLLGGLLIGFAAGPILLVNGHIAGMSGTGSSGARPRSADAAWQALFLVGLVAGGMLLSWLDPAALPVGQITPIQLTLAAGLLVGFGARVDGGCSSGHAPCGVGRLSRRSMVAVGCFVIAGTVGVWTMHHFWAAL